MIALKQYLSVAKVTASVLAVIIIQVPIVMKMVTVRQTVVLFAIRDMNMIAFRMIVKMQVEHMTISRLLRHKVAQVIKPVSQAAVAT
jgi:hypothetical protein